jgi:hypothetical protein
MFRVGIRATLECFDIVADDVIVVWLTDELHEAPCFARRLVFVALLII